MLKPNVFTPINTPRLLIRRMKLDDIPFLYSYRSNPLVSEFQNWAPTNIEETREFIIPILAKDRPSKGDWFQVGLYLQSTDEMVGDIGIHLLENSPNQAELGISLCPTHQKHGYAQEALRGVFDYLFVDLCIRRIIGSVDPRNAPSISLLERIGMRKEAHFIQSYWSKGEWTDDVIFAMLNTEWNNRKCGNIAQPFV